MGQAGPAARRRLGLGDRHRVADRVDGSRGSPPPSARTIATTVPPLTSSPSRAGIRRSRGRRRGMLRLERQPGSTEMSIGRTVPPVAAWLTDGSCSAGASPVPLPGSGWTTTATPMASTVAAAAPAAASIQRREPGTSVPDRLEWTEPVSHLATWMSVGSAVPERRSRTPTRSSLSAWELPLPRRVRRAACAGRGAAPSEPCQSECRALRPPPHSRARPMR